MAKITIELYATTEQVEGIIREGLAKKWRLTIEGFVNSYSSSDKEMFSRDYPYVLIRGDRLTESATIKVS